MKTSTSSDKKQYKYIHSLSVKPDPLFEIAPLFSRSSLSYVDSTSSQWINAKQSVPQV